MTEDISPIDRLRSLLTELLQLDHSDLDFGIYRLLRLKRAEVEAFLDEQLPRSVTEAFAAVGEEQRSEAEADVAALAARLREDVAEDVLNADGSVFFAGSGSTGHAVLNHNREAEGEPRRFILVEQGRYFDQLVARRIKRAIYAAKWKDRKPVLEDDPEAGATPRVHPLIKILRLESYEDSLHNLVSAETCAREGPRRTAVRAAVGDDEYRIRYLARLPMEASASLLNLEKLAHPFRYELEVLTDDGPKVRKVDLVETFNLVYGVKVRRIVRWLNEGDGNDGRLYVAVVGEDPEGQRTLVLWRDMEDLDPALERAFLEPMIGAAADTPFDVILINGDSTVPGVRSLDPDFKTRICEGEVG